MKLFKDRDRNDNDTKMQSESIYAYLNRSARPEMEKVRELLESCFADYPADTKDELRSRMVRGVEYDSAAFELILHAMLLREGYNVQIHPSVPGATKTPDFLAERGDTVFYLEAVLDRSMSDDEAVVKKLEGGIYDTINTAEPYDYWLQIIRVEQRRRQMHSARRLKIFLREELGKMDIDDLESLLHKSGTLDALPVLRFDDGDTLIDIRPIPRSPSKRGDSSLRNVGAYPIETELKSSIESIQGSLKSKASRYGILDRPYVTAVNSTSFWHPDDDDIKAALYGSEGMQILPSGDTRLIRYSNGAFMGPKGLQNTRVSAVLFGSISPSTLASTSLKIYHHLGAKIPLPEDALSVPQYGIEINANGKIESRQTIGRTVREIFGLSPEWPL